MKQLKTILCTNKLMCVVLIFFLALLAGFDVTQAAWQKRGSMDDKSLTKIAADDDGDDDNSYTNNTEQPSAASKSETSSADKAKATTTAKSDEKSTTDTDKEDAVDDNVSFNFKDANLSNLINYMAETKNLNLIPSSDTADVKVSLNMREVVNRENAWEVFTTILDVSGFCIVKSGILDKVIRKDAKNTESHPLYVGVPAEKIPASSKIIRYVLFPKYVSTQEAEMCLKNFLDPKTQIISQPTMNAVIITDRAESIKYALTILSEIDKSAVKENCQIIRLNNSNVSDVKKFLDELIKKPETSGLARLLGQQSEGGADFFPGNVKLIPEERTNSLIMLGPPTSLKKLEDFILKYFEGNWRVKTPFYPYECQYSEADQIKGILDDIIQAEASAAKSGGNSSRGGARYLGNVRIEADKYSNKLIIYSQDKKDLELVLDLISDLDKPQPMVALEALIVQVTQTETKNFGGQFHNRTMGQPIPGVDFQAGTLAPVVLQDANQVTSLLGNLMSLAGTAQLGTTLLTLGKGSKNDVFAVFKAVKAMDNSNIIANPFITIANRQKGNMSVGDKIRVVNEKGAGDGAITGYTPVEAATSLVITPQISPNGYISLDLDVDISDFTAEDGTSQNKKRLQTNVTMSDGQILVLGGFIKTRTIESKSKTPGFGDLPLFGWLAKSKNRDTQKSYIFIFMSPTIIKPRKAPGADLYTKIKLHDASKMVDASSETQRSMDPINNFFFNYKEQDPSHKIVDFANARYQPTTVDLQKDPIYRGKKIENVSDEQATEVLNREISVGNDSVKVAQIKNKAVEDLEEQITEEVITQSTVIKQADAKMPKQKTTKTIVKPSTTPALDSLAALKPQDTKPQQGDSPLALAKKATQQKNAAMKESTVVAVQPTEVSIAKEEPLLTQASQKPAVVLQPVAQQTETPDLDLGKIMAKERKIKDIKVLGTSQAKPSLKAQQDAWDNELDEMFLQKPKIIKVSADNSKKLKDADVDLGKLFKNDRARKYRPHAFQEDFVAQDTQSCKTQGHSQFSKQFSKDAANSLETDEFSDDFDTQMAAKRAKKAPKSSKILAHQAEQPEIIIKSNDAFKRAEKNRSPETREAKFKNLILAKKAAANEAEEGA